jgi:hypothetical protein
MDRIFDRVHDLSGFKGGPTYWYLYKLNTLKCLGILPGISTCLEMYSLWYPIATKWPRLEQGIYVALRN